MIMLGGEKHQWLSSGPRDRRSLVPMAGKKDPRKVVITQGAIDWQVVEETFLQ